jgi:hypothetical protein
MGKSAPEPPAAPDPKITIAAQTDSNAATARLQAQLNRVNQVGPTGTVSWTQSGQGIDRTTWENSELEKARSAWTAANPPGTMQPAPISNEMAGGENNSPQSGGGDMQPMQPATFDEAAFRRSLEGQATPTVPGQDQWTQTTELSPEQQRLYDLATQAQTTYGEIGNNQLNAVKGALSQPDVTDYGAAREQALAAQMARLNPQYAQQEESLRTRLINQGLTEGSEGWNRAFGQFNQGRNDAMIAADLNAGNTVGQQIAQTTALRARPLNETAALLTGQQVQTPQAMAGGQANVAPVDAMGAYNTQYQGQMAAYNAQMQQQNATMGGLFGLAGTLGGAAMKYGPGLLALSDMRAKKDILEIGKAHNGLPLYAYRYKGSDTPQIGLMAQDVERVNPGAVETTSSGLKAVDYGKALLNG